MFFEADGEVQARPAALTNKLTNIILVILGHGRWVTYYIFIPALHHSYNLTAVTLEFVNIITAGVVHGNEKKKILLLI